MSGGLPDLPLPHHTDRQTDTHTAQPAHPLLFCFHKSLITHFLSQMSWFLHQTAHFLSVFCCPEPFCEMRVIMPGWDCGAANPGFTGRPSLPRTRVHKAKWELPSPACFPPTFSTVSHSRVSLSFLISSVSHPLNLARSPLGSLLGHLLTPYSTSFGLSPSFPCLCLFSQRYLLGRKLCLLPMSNPTLAVCSCSGPFLPL